ncbi:MAG: alkene reductase [Alteromonadaceae bacterium]|nr:MAG: alkene reductase [Alteromonadaceae bacterium]
MDKLFEPLELSPQLQLKNRIVMAPLTRSMADDELVPTEAMADYYARRADAGLIISEATLIAQEGQGYPNTPGIYSSQQISQWQKVTQGVHAKGGKIFSQLWHTGKASHSIYHDGEQPMAPSAVAVEGRVPRVKDLYYETPRVMTQEDIDRVIGLYVKAAENALEAGFDGVELHGANGYLIDQFLHWDSNRRDDQYGGNSENMARFLFQVLDAVTAVIPANLVGLRLSPYAYFNLKPDNRDKAVFDYLLPLLNRYGLAYIHTGMFKDRKIDLLECTVTQYIRKHYQGTVIASGGYEVKSAMQTLEQADADLIAIGRPFIANSDYVEKVQQNKPLTPYTEDMLATLY